MKRTLKITFVVLFWLVVGVYLLWASHLSNRHRERLSVSDMEISIRDSSRIQIVSSSTVRGWIDKAGLNPEGRLMDDVSPLAIRRIVGQKLYVSHAKVYTDMNGKVSVEVLQRRPTVRFATSGGYNFYYSSDNCVLPVPLGSSYYSMIVTGDMNFPFERNFTGSLDKYLDENKKKSSQDAVYFHKLVNFVNYLNNDDFWNAQFVQINMVKAARGGGSEPEIELVPRIGDHVVMLGTLDGYVEKLDKLSIFYRKVRGWEGWHERLYINLKYDHQMVCSRMR